MGAALRTYRRRIAATQSTKKITKAMELIAASRIAKAQQRMTAAKPYAVELKRALAELSQDTTLKHPMLTGVENPRRAGILIVTSDRGLAGGYNANVIRKANDLADTLEGEGKQVERYVIGRKGVAYYRFRQIELAGAWTGFSEQPNFGDARGATESVVAALEVTSEGTIDGGERDGRQGIDELWIVYTEFVNSVSQTPRAEQISPVTDSLEDDDEVEEAIEKEKESTEGGARVVYDFEPEPAKLIAALLPRYVSSRIFTALLTSATSESAARRRAMKSASDNATDLIKTFTRLANEARQAEITQEISEIVGGADALAASGADD